MTNNDHEMQALVDPEKYFRTGKKSGLMRARVLNVNDPERRYRIQVRILQLHLDPVQALAVLGQGKQGLNDELCPWAEPCFPFGGDPGYGFFMLPKVGATVWVAYELGDVNKPVWMGSWHGTGDVTSEGDNPARKKDASHLDGPDRLRIIKAPSGHLLYFDDGDTEAGISPKIKLKTAGNIDLTLDDKPGLVKAGLTMPSGAKMELQDSPIQTASIFLSSTRKIEMGPTGIKATEGAASVEITPLGVVNIVAPLALNGTSPAVNFSGPAATIISDATQTLIQRGAVIIRINAAGEIDLISAAKVTINGGALVNINASNVQVNSGQVDLGAPGGDGVMLGPGFAPKFLGHVHEVTPGVPTGPAEFPFGAPAALVAGTDYSASVKATP